MALRHKKRWYRHHLVLRQGGICAPHPPPLPTAQTTRRGARRHKKRCVRPPPVLCAGAITPPPPPPLVHKHRQNIRLHRKVVLGHMKSTVAPPCGAWTSWCLRTRACAHVHRSRKKRTQWFKVSVPAPQMSPFCLTYMHKNFNDCCLQRPESRPCVR